MIYTRDDIELLAAAPGPSGARVAFVSLAPGDRAWNPERNDTLLRGPAHITYVIWPDAGVDVRVKVLTPATD